jgi:AAA domain
VENGGGMSLLADALGYAQLTEPLRFRAAWEQAASLRLRAGDTTVLAEYDQHGRIYGGDPEQMIDAAAAYLALTLDDARLRHRTGSLIPLPAGPH